MLKFYNAHKQTIQLIRLSFSICAHRQLSHICQIVNCLLVPSIEHLSKAFKWVLDVLCLKCAHLEEFKADALSESQTVLGANGDSIFNVNFVGYDNSH